MRELVRRAGVVLLWLLVAISVVIGEWRKSSYAPAYQLRPKGAEWRSIWRLPAGRVCAVRLQVILA